MGRYRHQVFATATTPRFCVIFGLQWQVLESIRLPPGADLAVAMTTTLKRLSDEEWQAEGSHAFGFVFIRRAGERRLLILTERDPYDMRPQSFSPFT